MTPGAFSMRRVGSWPRAATHAVDSDSQAACGRNTRGNAYVSDERTAPVTCGSCLRALAKASGGTR